MTGTASMTGTVDMTDNAGMGGGEGSGAVYAPYPARPEGRFSRLVLALYERSPRWAAPAAVALCVAGAVAYTLAEDRSHVTGPTPCLLRLTTGFDCPGCGGTRAAWFLLHGGFSQAARHHAVFVFAVPFLLYSYVAWTINVTFGRNLPVPRITPTHAGIFLGVWFVWATLRNLPWAPFTWFYV